MSTWSTARFEVPSSSRPGAVRTVTHTDGAGWGCDCPWEQYRRPGQKRCSHIASVEREVRDFAWQVYGESWPDPLHAGYYCCQMTATPGKGVERRATVAA